MNELVMDSLLGALESSELWLLHKKCREKMGPGGKFQLMDFEEQLIKDDHMILAIKSLRYRTYEGLKKCKDLCDEFRKRTLGCP